MKVGGEAAVQVSSCVKTLGLPRSQEERYWRECKKSVKEQEGELEGNDDQVRGCVINRAQKAEEGE